LNEILGFIHPKQTIRGWKIQILTREKGKAKYKVLTQRWKNRMEKRVYCPIAAKDTMTGRKGKKGATNQVKKRPAQDVITNIGGMGLLQTGGGGNRGGGRARKRACGRLQDWRGFRGRRNGRNFDW